MSDKPSYLGLLNAIALGESRAHCYLSAWIEVTPSDDVRRVLATVAAREGEHGMAFAKRLNELGYGVLQRDDPKFEDNLAVAKSDRTDLEKMELLGLGRLDTGDRPDIFDGFFSDHSIDIRTGELLGPLHRRGAGLGPTPSQLLRAAEGRRVAAGDGRPRGRAGGQGRRPVPSRRGAPPDRVRPVHGANRLSGTATTAPTNSCTNGTGPLTAFVR